MDVMNGWMGNAMRRFWDLGLGRVRAVLVGVKDSFGFGLVTLGPTRITHGCDRAAPPDPTWYA